MRLQVVAHRLEGATSHFAPYINNLPLGVAGLPMFFNGDALGALQYPPVTEQVKRRCRWLLSFSQQALAPIRGSEADPFGGAEVDANALGWALAVVTSRAFRTRGPSQV
jgi:histone-lysine N-methyltransferase SETD3